MNLGHKIYNDLVNNNMSISNGYCGVFDLYPKIKVQLFIDYINTNTEIGVDNHPIYNLHKNNAAQFFENIPFEKMTWWLLENMPIIYDGMTLDQMEKYAGKALNLICDPSYGRNPKENWYEYFDLSVFEDANAEFKQEMSESIIAVFGVCHLLILDFKLLLQRVLFGKYNININVYPLHNYQYKYIA